MPHTQEEALGFLRTLGMPLHDCHAPQANSKRQPGRSGRPSFTAHKQGEFTSGPPAQQVKTAAYESYFVLIKRACVFHVAHARSLGICTAGLIGDEPRLRALRVGVDSTGNPVLRSHKTGLAGQRGKPRRRHRQTTVFSSRMNFTHLRKPHVRMRARPLDLHSPVSSLIRPPARHFASRRVLCPPVTSLRARRVCRG